MDQIIKLLPLILGMMSKGGQVGDLLAAISEIVAKFIALLPAEMQPQPKTLDVKWLQTSLKTLGFDPGPIDGVYGEKVKAAVSAFQKARDLVVDGWAGVMTQAKIIAELPKA